MGAQMKQTQHPAELAAFVDLVRKQGVTSYLEIGMKIGHSLKAVASAMPAGSRLVIVDLERRRNDFARILRDEALNELAKRHDVHFIPGDSTDAQVVEKVRTLGPFDLAFIDANHKHRYVKADWQNYGPMSRMVAFHDVADRAMAVAGIWDGLKAHHRHVEFKMDPAGKNGIGVLWRGE